MSDLHVSPCDQNFPHLISYFGQKTPTLGSNTYSGVLSRLTPETVPHLLPATSAPLVAIAVPIPRPGLHPMCWSRRMPTETGFHMLLILKVIILDVNRLQPLLQSYFPPH